MEKTWVDGPKVTTDLFHHVIKAREITNLAAFLEPQWPSDLYDPLLLPDMEPATSRIWRAILAEEKIGIVGDYDMDGTPAAALLAQFISLVGTPPEIILPSRAEGYGFSTEFVERLAALKVTLIITVDCGIRDTEAVALASAKGIDVIITDHHECPEILPAALAVINPKRRDSRYPFAELSGTGVAYKLVTALVQTAPDAAQSKIPDGWLAWSLDIVAMATIGDMVPLVSENRTLVYYGMKVLKKTKRLGLRRFLEALELSPEELNYSDIAYKIIPKFNASGRLESMDDVFVLLSSQNVAEVDAAVKAILSRSTQCQLILADMLEQARQKVMPSPSDTVILVADDRWHPGLTGLVAMRLVEEYKCPVGVLAGVDDERYRGSMRSVYGVKLPELLTSATHLIDKFGGHEQAAGLTIPKSNLSLLQQALSQAAEVSKSSPRQLLITSGQIEADTVSLDTVEKLQQLAPWGVGNEEPLWSFRNVKLSDIRWLSDGRHLKAKIGGVASSLSLIYFGAEAVKPFVDGPVDIFGTISINEFRGNKEPQLMVRGMCQTPEL